MQGRARTPAQAMSAEQSPPNCSCPSGASSPCTFVPLHKVRNAPWTQGKGTASKSVRPSGSLPSLGRGHHRQGRVIRVRAVVGLGPTPLSAPCVRPTGSSVPLSPEGCKPHVGRWPPTASSQKGTPFHTHPSETTPEVHNLLQPSAAGSGAQNHFEHFGGGQ